MIAAIIALRDDGGVGDRLARMTMPCLIILGEHESTQQQARQAAAALPNGEFVSVTGIGHAMVHADLIMPHVEPFLTRLRP